MATIKFSSIVSDVRGLIGGTVFARGANGSYIRSFAKSANKNTELQQIKRNNLATYAAKWRGLTDEERNQWNQATAQYPYTNRVGDVCHYTGFQLFMKVNLTLETAALDT